MLGAANTRKTKNQTKGTPAGGGATSRSIGSLSSDKEGSVPVQTGVRAVWGVGYVRIVTLPRGPARALSKEELISFLSQCDLSAGLQDASNGADVLTQSLRLTQCRTEIILCLV